MDGWVDDEAYDATGSSPLSSLFLGSSKGLWLKSAK